MVNPKIVVPHPYALSGHNIGGLASVIAAELRGQPERLRDVTFLTADSHSGDIGGVRVLNATPDAPQDAGVPMSRRLWGHWCTLFPKSYTAPACPPEALHGMYNAGQYSHQIGSFECMLEHVARFAPGRAAEERFFSRYGRRFTDSGTEGIEPGSIVNFQDFLWFGAINEYGDALRAKGCYLKGTGHTSYPDNLYRSEIGRGFLSAISKLDVFYVHADEFARRIGNQLQTLGLPVPELKTMNLGIDQGLMHASLAKVSPSNFTQSIPGFKELSANQRGFIGEIFKAQQNPDCTSFMCIDRIDIVKRLHVVIYAIDKFLQSRLDEGESTLDLRAKYKFFFLNLKFTSNDPSGGDNLSAQYGTWLEQEFERVLGKEQYKGVVFRGDPLTGDQRIGLPALMRNSVLISGGGEEGLHLSTMEGLFVNRGLAKGAILPTGAGFALQAIESGFDDPSYFPQVDDVSAYVGAIRAWAGLTDISKARQRSITNRLVDQLVIPRKHSVLFD